MILIVEDEPRVGAGLEKMFRFAGHDAVCVTTGMEALSLLHLRHPTLILIDLALPVMDGLTLLRAIRSDPSFNRVPIVIHTSNFSKKMETEAREAGAQDYIIKGTLGWDAMMARIASLAGVRSTPSLRISK